MAQMVKNSPAMQETWVLSLDWEDTLETGMATDSTLLVWRIRQTKKSWGHKELDTTEQLTLSLFHFHSIANILGHKDHIQIAQSFSWKY